MDKIIISVLFCFIGLFAQGKEDFLKDHVCTVLPSLEGWCSREKALSFIDLVLEVEPKVCVEIGVFGGASVFPVASALKYLGKGVVIGIDPWERSECIKYYHPIEEQTDFKWWSCLDFNYIYDSYCSMLRRYGLGEYSITVKSTSGRAAFLIDDIDILYIDGNADEGVTTQDVEDYFPKVKKNGYIWINNAIWPQRQTAIDILSENCEFIKAIDFGNCLLFQKR
jgi:hypothetical protein